MIRPALLLFALLAVAPPAGAQRFEPRATTGLWWFKGNTHSHTTESDGDSPPDVVARWYKDHGYRFLVLSDHNVFTDPTRFPDLVDSTFLLIGGEELTSQFERRPVHVNGLALTERLEPETAGTMAATIQRNVDVIRRHAGVPHINHPNFRWAFGLPELLQVRNDPLLEIHNGHPLVHNEGGDGSAGMEEIWDGLLSVGKRIYGIAVDDAHHFQGPFTKERSNPGRGWVVIAAERLETGLLMQSLERGQFYASSGVTLESVEVSSAAMAIRIRPDGDFKYTTTFIGDHGRIVARVGGLAPTYTLNPSRDRKLRYVRARVDDSGGFRAWIQPAFLAGEHP